jgi:hypothetical protein
MKTNRPAKMASIFANALLRNRYIARDAARRTGDSATPIWTMKLTRKAAGGRSSYHMFFEGRKVRG